MALELIMFLHSQMVYYMIRVKLVIHIINAPLSQDYKIFELWGENILDICFKNVLFLHA